jgi:hypothetical protein
MSEWRSKQREHGISGILLHRAPVALDLLPHLLEVGILEVADFLWIKPFRERGEADEITEESSDQAALFRRSFFNTGSGGRSREFDAR